MRMVLVSFLLIAAAVCFPQSTLAQDTGTPEEFTAAYMAATRTSDWAQVAAYMHPEALTQFKKLFGDIAAADSSGEVLSGLFGVSSAAAYRAAPPETIFASFMKSLTRLSPGMTATLAGSSIEAIGSVSEQPAGNTYVVYRMKADAEGVTITKINVLPLRKHDGKWRALLTGDMEGLAAALKGRITG